MAMRFARAAGRPSRARAPASKDFASLGFGALGGLSISMGCRRALRLRRLAGWSTRGTLRVGLPACLSRATSRS
eukprot:2893387-Pyramimonas_sp.AAC.1